MNKTIVYVEPIPTITPVLKKLCDKHEDRLVLINSKRISNYQTVVLNLYVDMDKVESVFAHDGIKPDVIFTTNEAFLKQTLELTEKFNTQNVQSQGSNLRSKKMMKKAFQEKNVPHAKGKFYRRVSEIDFKKISFPLIIKPSTGYASAGVRLVNNVNELKEQLQVIGLLNAFSFKRENIADPGFILEEYIDGPEYACDSIWQNGKRVVTFVQRNLGTGGELFPDKLYFVDPEITSRLQQRMEAAEEKVQAASQITQGFSHTEYKIYKGTPYVIETTNRPGAGGGFFEAFKLSTGLSPMGIFYDCVIDKKKQTNPLVNYEPDHYYYMDIPQLPVGEVVGTGGIVDILRKKEGIRDVTTTMKENMTLQREDARTFYPMTITGTCNSNVNLHDYIQNLDDFIVKHVKYKEESKNA